MLTFSGEVSRAGQILILVRGQCQAQFMGRHIGKVYTRTSRGMLRPLFQELTVTKPTKTKNELSALVAAVVAGAVRGTGVIPPFIEGHIRDGRGRNWDVSIPAPTPAHRKAIDSVRDQFDLVEAFWKR